MLKDPSHTSHAHDFNWRLTAAEERDRQVIERIARIEAKLDLMLNSLDNQTKDHERRISSLEKAYVRMSAIATAVASTVSLLVSNLPAVKGLLK